MTQPMDAAELQGLCRQAAAHLAATTTVALDAASLARSAIRAEAPLADRLLAEAAAAARDAALAAIALHDAMADLAAAQEGECYWRARRAAQEGAP